MLYITKADGKPGDEQQIAYDALGQVWSPDGNEVMYFSLRNLVIFTVEPKIGAPATQFRTPNNIGAWFPTYTADGKSIVFYGTPNANYLSNSLDQNATFLTPTASPAPTVTPAPTNTPATTAAGSPVASATPAVSPTATPSPTPLPNQVSNLYIINRDGTGLRQVATIEDNTNISAGSLLAAYVNNGAEGVAFLTSRPYYKMSPAYAQDGKRIAVPVITKENTGIQVVTLDGSVQPIKINGGEGGLEAGTRLNPAFSADGSRLIYLFQPPQKDKPVEVRVYDLNAKSEMPFAKENTYGFPTCCGFKK
jgi:Tol biopolymer transport system component